MKNFYIDKISFGYSRAEFWLKIEPPGDGKDDMVFIILSLPAAKRLLEDLRLSFEKWKAENPKAVQLADNKSKSQETVPRRVLKALYKSRKLTKNLISINTKKRKHIESD